MMEGFLRGRVYSPCQREDWEDESAWKHEHKRRRIRRWKREGERLKNRSVITATAGS